MMSMADYLSRVKSDGDVGARIAPPKVKDDCRVSLIELEEEIDIAELDNAQQTDQRISSWISSVSNNWKDVEIKDRPQAHERMIVDGDGLLRVLYNGGRMTKKDPFGVTVKYLQGGSTGFSFHRKKMFCPGCATVHPWHATWVSGVHGKGLWIHSGGHR